MIQLDTANVRAARMLEAGRASVTFRSPSGTHITIRAKARKPRESGQGWEGCPLDEARVLFFEVPNAEGGWNDRVAKMTSRGGFQPIAGADPARVWCARQLVNYVMGRELAEGLEVFEEDRCGRCGRELTDPVSIERGIGPECYGRMTGSRHQVRNELPEEVLFTDAELELGYHVWVNKRMVRTTSDRRSAVEDAHAARRSGARHAAVYTKDGELVVELDD